MSDILTAPLVWLVEGAARFAEIVKPLPRQASHGYRRRAPQPWFRGRK
jgi:hypothetical protein